jgi:hypothetical protein
MVTNASGAKPAAGFLFKASGQFSLQNCSVNNCINGLYLNPSSGADIQSGHLSDCIFDSCGVAGVQIYTPNQASPGRVTNIDFIGCQMSATNPAGIGNGVYINGASNGVLNDVSFTSCQILGNGTDGVGYGFGTNVRFENCTIAGNSASSSNSYDGISILTAISDFQIIGNKIGTAGLMGNTQRRAITLAAGASTRYQIKNNDVGSNQTPPWISDGGTGTFKQIMNNVGSLPIPAMPAMSTAMQALGVSANVVTGSLIPLPVNGLMVGSRFAWDIVLIKTAAGTATWALQVKFGTTGGTGDTAIASWTSGTNTAAVDQMTIRIICEILTLGASATARCNAFSVNSLTAVTGLSRLTGAPTATATFNSAGSPAYIHIGCTPGASAVMTSMSAAQIILPG